MSSHFFTQSPQNFAVEPGIYISGCWEKNSLCTIPPMSKKVMIILLRLLFTCVAFFWPWWRGAFPLGGLSLCLSVVTVNPALITSDDPRQERFIVGSELTKSSADVDALLLLVSCQDPGHKFGCDRVHAQFFRQNPLACPITNFHLLSNVANGPMLILLDELLNSCNSSSSCATWSSSADVWPVLNQVCHWNTCVRLKLWSPKPCWIILRVSIALFPRLAQNLMHTCCSFLWSIMKIAMGHVHDSKKMHVKTAHVILSTWNLACWLAKHGSHTIYRCFALPQLLYRWWHQYRKFWINPCM